jgi:hypothetical protein
MIMELAGWENKRAARVRAALVLKSGESVYARRQPPVCFGVKKPKKPKAK